MNKENRYRAHACQYAVRAVQLHAAAHVLTQLFFENAKKAKTPLQ